MFRGSRDPVRGRRRGFEIARDRRFRVKFEGSDVRWTIPSELRLRWLCTVEIRRRLRFNFLGMAETHAMRTDPAFPRPSTIRRGPQTLPRSTGVHRIDLRRGRAVEVPSQESPRR
ncbi:MAG: hypothetical protein CL933_20325 [Deltaproteobacteria bacterium]|nr:hypothetical protein [Deltaproteobacteria bacterium]